MSKRRKNRRIEVCPGVSNDVAGSLNGARDLKKKPGRNDKSKVTKPL